VSRYKISQPLDELTKNLQKNLALTVNLCLWLAPMERKNDSILSKIMGILSLCKWQT
jgi:hypothetical protein